MIRNSALLLLALFFATGCGEGTEGQYMGDCSDGIDNDGDAKADQADPDCG